MLFDLESLSAADRYELLLGTIVPRPIAIVTTVSKAGAINAAPYSLFNVVGNDPPVIALAILPHAQARFKDTAENIFATKEFVLNLVSEDIAEAMNIVCVDAPAGRNELEFTDLHTTPSEKLAAPRIAESPAAFGCRFLTSMSFGAHQTVIFGQVVEAHIPDSLVSDASRCVVDTPALKLIGGMHGARWYSRTGDLFALDRPTWAGWIKEGRQR